MITQLHSAKSGSRHELDRRAVRVAQLQRRIPVLERHTLVLDPDSGQVVGPCPKLPLVTDGKGKMVEGAARGPVVGRPGQYHDKAASAMPSAT